MRGAPILTAACYCDDCQAGAEKLEALPGARPFHDADGGTWMALYRKDRHRVVRGAERLERTKLKPKSGTNRVVARCCNSAMLVDFDGGPHWISIYRPGYAGARAAARNAAADPLCAQSGEDPAATCRSIAPIR